MVAAMGKYKINIVFLIHILHGWGLYEFKWYNIHKLLCLRVPLPPEFFFSSEQNYSGKNYVLRERANLPNRGATDLKSFMPLIWKDIWFVQRLLLQE